MAVLNKSDRRVLTELPFPPQQLFQSRDDAHELFMEDIAWVLRQARELDCYPSEELFLESVKTVWLEVWQRYCPRD